MSKETAQNEFTGLRGVFWPIHNFELKKFIPMGLMMFCILFNYTILRDTKDVLVINAPGGGAEVLGFLKLYFVTPSAILFIILFAKLVNMMEREKVFYSIILPFLIFFGAFAFVIYPNREIFHMSLETIRALQAEYPALHWFIPVIGNWSFSVFYVLSELWGSAILAMLFWQFANQICKVTEAKRFYSLFGFIGQGGLILSGSVIIISSQFAKTVTAADPYLINLKIQMSMVVAFGLVCVGIYYWMHRVILTDKRFYDPEQVAGPKKKKEKLSIGESFVYIMKSPYLGLIAVLVLAYGVSINLVEGVWKGQIKIAFPDHNDYAEFMGQFSLTTGIATAAIMIIGSNILRRFSWKIAAMITPIMVLITSVLFFGFVMYGNQHSPTMAFMGTTLVMMTVLVGLVQNVLSKATKYSLFDSTKQMAYIPLDPELKAKGQAAVEVIGGRAGKSGGAFIQSTMLMIVGGGASLASLAPILGSLVIFVVIAWIVSVLGLSKRFEEMTAATNSPETKPAAA